MTNEEFEKVVKDCIENINNVLNNKAKEYASGEDRLHNFVVASQFMNTTKPYVVMGMANKHFVSIRDIVIDYEKTGKLPTKEMLDEKIGDAINYLILLKACFLEDIDGKESVE